MKETGTKNTLLAAGVFVCGTMGSIELPKGHGLSHRFMNEGVTISMPTAAARQAEPIRRSSCALIRYYVAKYSVPAAEAWARSKARLRQKFRLLGVVLILNRPSVLARQPRSKQCGKSVA